MTGRHHSPETREKMRQAALRRFAKPEEREKLRQAHLGKALSPEHRENLAEANRRPETREKRRHAALGKRPTAETRAKMSIARMGHAVSPETREKLRRGHRGPPLLSAEHRKHIGQALLGHVVSPETREKISLANRGKRHVGRVVSAETRERISRAQRGKALSPERREALREAHLQPESQDRQRQARLCRSPIKMTDIERLLYEEFKRRGLDFIMHLPMWGRFAPDFCLESAKLIVQADGGWWHSLPKVRALEAALLEVATAEGFTVLRFSDKQIKSDPAAIGRAVAAFVRRHAVPSAPSQPE